MSQGVMSISEAPGNQKAPSKTVDVVIIGAGLSGLQAALRLQAEGVQCIVLEATARVGGKVLSVASRKDGSGVTDVGAAWINDTSQSEMFKLFQRYGLKSETQRTTGQSLYQIAEGSTFATPFNELPLEGEDLAALGEILTVLRTLSEESNLENPAAGPNAAELDKVTFIDYMKTAVKSEVSEIVARGFARAFFGVEPDEISMLFMVNYCKSGTGIDNLISDYKDGGQYLKARQGMDSIARKMAEELLPESLYLSSPVDTVEQSSSELCSVHSTTGTIFRCKKVIVTIPTCLYPSINFSPPLPKSKRLLAENTALGYYTKVVFVFDDPWWRNAGLSGVLNSESGPISLTWDTSIPGEQWSISCFVIGEPGRQWSKLSKSARTTAIWNHFTTTFKTVVDTIPEPSHTIELEWSKEEYIWGAPSPVMGPGVLTQYGSELRTPFENVHFIGTETSIVWKGYMEGAVRSGIRGTDEVIAALHAKN